MEALKQTRFSFIFCLLPVRSPSNKLISSSTFHSYYKLVIGSAHLSTRMRLKSFFLRFFLFSTADESPSYRNVDKEIYYGLCNASRTALWFFQVSKHTLTFHVTHRIYISYIFILIYLIHIFGNPIKFWLQAKSYFRHRKSIFLN